LQSPIEVLLAREIASDVWEALVRPGRKVGTGEHLIFGDNELQAEVIARGEYGLRMLRFDGQKDLLALIERLGHTPLPPYIHRSYRDRDDEAMDRERYQTVFAKHSRAVAAPTAGLHFTPEILERVRARGIPILEITLDVGLGTFQPIRSDVVETHRMHCEGYRIPDETAAGLATGRREGRRVLAVGTTVVRALEDAATRCSVAPTQSRVGKNQGVAAGKAAADIFIYPGFEFRIVDALLTNFHLPRTSLLAMVSAFAGREHILRAYQHAIAQGYRFYSYGDCMLIR
jgi:S-adenosylmethionine:tRNA ribosyltransferase-isomerase